MNILTIPVRCMRKKWGRSLALFSIFLLGVSSIVALYKVSSAVGEGFERKLSTFGANIIISPKKESINVSYGGISLGDVQMDQGRFLLEPALESIKHIELADRLALIAPKLVGIMRLPQTPDAKGPVQTPGQGQSTQTPQNLTTRPSLTGQLVPVIGVDWNTEVDLKQYWMVNGSFPEPESSQNAELHEGLHEGLIGHRLAGKLGLSKGSHLSFGEGKPEFIISGVLHPTGGDDDNVLFISLASAQILLQAPGKADFIEVAALCSACPIEDIVHELGAALPELETKALRQVVAQRMYAINFAQHLALVIGLVILLSACAMVVMSMLSAVTERRKETGLLRAVGFSRFGVFGVFAFEAAFIGIFAGIFGYILGFAASKQIVTALSLEVESRGFSLANLGELALCTVLVTCVAIIAAAIPAWKATRQDPVSALASL